MRLAFIDVVFFVRRADHFHKHKSKKNCLVLIQLEKYNYNQNLVRFKMNQDSEQSIYWCITKCNYNLNLVWFKMKFSVCACILSRSLMDGARTNLQNMTAAVRETIVYRHNEGPDSNRVMGPRTITTLSYWGVLNWSPIMPRDGSLSDSGCNLFPKLDALRELARALTH